MTKKRENKFLSFIVVVILIIFVGAIYMVIKSGSLYQNIYNNQSTSSQVYKSKNLKFNMLIPDKSDVLEAQTYVDITINGMLLDVVRNGTNFRSLREYVKDFDTKKRIVIAEENFSTISDYQAISRIEKNKETGKRQKIYYIYAENWVYSLSTTSEGLFGDLDKIAQSFKYTP